MTKVFRDVVAIACFGASAVCLAVWGLTALRPRLVFCELVQVDRQAFDLQFCNGVAKVAIYRSDLTRPRTVTMTTTTLSGEHLRQFDQTIQSNGYFATGARSVYFPLWYPVLIFALAGVGVLRFRRQSSIRSALVATTIVAALIGMAVTL